MRYQCFKSKKNRRDFQQDKSSLAVCTVREDKTSRVELSSLYRESSSLSHTARRVRLAQGVESVLRSKSGMSHAASRFESSLFVPASHFQSILFIPAGQFESNLFVPAGQFESNLFVPASRFDLS